MIVASYQNQKMPSAQTNCPNCNASFSGLLFKSSPTPIGEIQRLKNIFEDVPDQTCSSCVNTWIDREADIARDGAGYQKKIELRKRQREASAIPVVSIDLLSSLQPGEFLIKGLVTAQAVRSSGFLIGIEGVGLDFSSTKSMEGGEAELLDVLRQKALDLGANAVIGLDLDFSDTGGFKSVLICAQGTAIWIADRDKYFG